MTASAKNQAELKISQFGRGHVQNTPHVARSGAKREPGSRAVAAFLLDLDVVGVADATIIDRYPEVFTKT